MLSLPKPPVTRNRRANVTRNRRTSGLARSAIVRVKRSAVSSSRDERLLRFLDGCGPPRLQECLRIVGGP